MSPRLPKLVAFDLDYTLWDLWIDTHISAPLHRNKDTANEVLDKHNASIEFYKDVAHILHRLRSAEVIIAACSRTHAPKLARQALELLLTPPEIKGDPAVPAIKFFDQLEIYPGSKISHFKKLHEKTGLPYSEMLFFDDERRHREVEALGVTFWLVPRGLNNNEFEGGLEKWRKGHPDEVLDEAS